MEEENWYAETLKLISMYPFKFVEKVAYLNSSHPIQIRLI